MKRFVQYGCGFTAPQGWINYDASPTLIFERLPLLGKLYTRNAQRFPDNVIYGDIVKGLPEKSNSCDAIYCSHVLEHLSFCDFKKAITNTFDILKPGGIFRGVLPDLRAAAEDYLASFDEVDTPAINFMNNTMLGHYDRKKGLSSAITDLWGNSKHLWMWDYKSLSYELLKAGFNKVRPAKFGDSKVLGFKDVEDEGRFYRAAAFECVK